MLTERHRTALGRLNASVMHIRRSWWQQIASAAPNIVFCQFDIAGENAGRFPAAGAHDGNGVKAAFQQVLGGPDAQGMPAEGADISGTVAGAFGGSFDDGFDHGVVEGAIERVVFVDWAKEPVGYVSAPVLPGLNPLRSVAGGKGNPALAFLICFAATDQDAQSAIFS